MEAVCDVIASKRRIRYIYEKNLFQADNKLYMVGYNNTDKRTEAVELDRISEIKMDFKHKDPNADEVLKSINVEECVKQKKDDVIYKGDIVFKCRGQYVQDFIPNVWAS